MSFLSKIFGPKEEHQYNFSGESVRLWTTYYRLNYKGNYFMDMNCI